MPVASLYGQFKWVFIVIAFFVVGAATPALWLIELSSGSGGAINISGSLRMQSYKMALAVADPYVSTDERAARTVDAVEEFSRRITSKGLQAGVPKEADDPVRIRYEALITTFRNQIEPAALASIRDEAARRRMVEHVPVFVAQVDDFVYALEDGLNDRLQLLKIVLGVTLVGSLGITFVMLQVMRQRIFEPLADLGEALSRVRSGAFDVRVDVGEQHEIGRLQLGFNFMTEELGRLYGSLEAEVAAKTADLHQRNELLRLLNRSTEALQCEAGDFERAVRKVLAEACVFLNAESAALYVQPSKGESMVCFALSGALNRGEDATVFPVSTVAGAVLGELRMTGMSHEAWGFNAGGMLSGILGRALERVLRRQDEHRLAVLEERATIARELHDSIAQSLSFSRIQLLRLQRAVDSGQPRDMLSSITAELREGINEAYRQLREVLTAFRLQVNASGLAGAVEEAVRAFESRTGIRVKLVNRYLGAELTANELVHLTHILREALMNIEKHARASEVVVMLEGLGNGGFRLLVEDNGVGIPEHAERAAHFGLSIMAERATALGANLSCERRIEGGTRVELYRTTVPESTYTESEHNTLSSEDSAS